MVELDLGNTPEETFDNDLVKELNVMAVPTVLLFNGDDAPVRIEPGGVAAFVRDVQKHLE